MAERRVATVLKTQSAVVSMDGSQKFPPGKATGLQVNAGDQLRFVCTGFIDEGDHNLGRIQVDGDGRAPDHHIVDDGPADNNYPLPGTTRYALGAGILDASNNAIARFVVGRVRTIAAPKTGSLVLFANDDKPADNKPIPQNKLQTPWVVSIDATGDDGIQPPVNTPGLEIPDIEVVQVCQDAADDSVMVGSKTTAVRAFLTSPDLMRLPARATVDGVVKVFSVPADAGPGSEVGTFKALNPKKFGTPNQVVIALKGQTIDRNQTSASLNFTVPGSVLPVSVDISHYRFEVTVSVGGIDNPGGPGFVATAQRMAGFVRPGQVIGLSVVRVRTPVDGSPPKIPILANMDWGSLAEQLPVPDDWAANALQKGSSIQSTSPALITLDVDVGDDGSNYGSVLGRLGGLVLIGQLKPAKPGDVLMGLVPPNPAPPANKQITSGLQSGNSVVVGTYSGASSIAAHEINHTLGLDHAAGPGCPTPSDVDASLPIGSDAPGWSSSGAQGIGSNTVVATQTRALMGYCPPPTWPTATEYDRGYRHLTGS